MGKVIDAGIDILCFVTIFSGARNAILNQAGWKKIKGISLFLFELLIFISSWRVEINIHHLKQRRFYL